MKNLFALTYDVVNYKSYSDFRGPSREWRPADGL